VRPAVNVGISVSRVGGAAQIKGMKKVAGRLRLDLAQFRELEAFASFGSELDASTQKQLARGERTVEILKQPQYQPMPVEKQIITLYAVTQGYLDEVPVERIREWESRFAEALGERNPEILEGLRTEKQLSEANEQKLVRAIETFNHEFGKGARKDAGTAAEAQPAAKA
jgi:F-type H+-transporting ATPase subunit alpha